LSAGVNESATRANEENGLWQWVWPSTLSVAWMRRPGTWNYSASQKTGDLTFDRNIGKCRPIFKILSPLDPEEILCTVYKYVCYAAFWNLKIKIAIDFSGISRERIYYSDSGRLLCFDIDIADIECLRDVAMPTNIGTTLAANGLCRQITTWGFRIKDGLFSINPYTSVSRSV